MWLRVSLMQHLHGCVTLLRVAFIVKLVQRLHDNLLLIRAYYGVCVKKLLEKDKKKKPN